MEALELEREVNRNLYGLLEKNVAESMSIIRMAQPGETSTDTNTHE